jgi:hypothetical protein
MRSSRTPKVDEAATLADVMKDLTRQGFTEQFVPVAGGVRGVQSGRTFRAGQVTITAYHRFEGVSDPDDMSILYALETVSGIRGTLADAFGVYADSVVGAFIGDVAVRRPLPPRASGEALPG